MAGAFEPALAIPLHTQGPCNTVGLSSTRGAGQAHSASGSGPTGPIVAGAHRSDRRAPPRFVRRFSASTRPRPGRVGLSGQDSRKRRSAEYGHRYRNRNSLAVGRKQLWPNVSHATMTCRSALNHRADTGGTCERPVSVAGLLETGLPAGAGNVRLRTGRAGPANEHVPAIGMLASPSGNTAGGRKAVVHTRVRGRTQRPPVVVGTSNELLFPHRVPSAPSCPVTHVKMRA